MNKYEMVVGKKYRHLRWPKTPFIKTKDAIVNLTDGNSIVFNDATSEDWEEITLKMSIIIEIDVS